MDIQSLTDFFMWCTIIDAGIIIFWSLFLILMPDFIYRVQNTFFPLPRDIFNTTIYGFIGLCKLFFLFFNVSPYVALLIIGH